MLLQCRLHITTFQNAMSRFKDYKSRDEKTVIPFSVCIAVLQCYIFQLAVIKTNQDYRDETYLYNQKANEEICLANLVKSENCHMPAINGAAE